MVGCQAWQARDGAHLSMAAVSALASSLAWLRLGTIPPGQAPCILWAVYELCKLFSCFSKPLVQRPI